MGIAIASGAPPAAGLVTGIIGGLLVGATSGCRFQVSGPAAGLAVIVYELIAKHGFEMLGPIVLLAGIIQLAAALLHAGQLFRAMAPAVIYGMLAGIGVLIFAAQFHVMVDDQPQGSGIVNLLSIPEAVYKGLWPPDGSSHHLAATLGLTTIVVILAWNKLAPKSMKWVPSALVGVLVATVAAQIWAMPVRYVELPDSLFSIVRVPGLEELQGLLDGSVLVAAITLAFVASAETLLSATAVDQMHDGPRTNYDRELLSQGLGNTLSGLVGGMPMTGVIVRSATNVAAGARTRLSAVLHGLWLLVFVSALPGVLRMVPTASLAAILVYTGYKLVNPSNIKVLMRYGRIPVAIYGITVVTIVATDLLTGILTGLALSLAKVLYALNHMEIEVRRTSRGRVDISMKGAATFIRLPRLLDALDEVPLEVEAHVHARQLDYIDHACLEALYAWHAKRDQRAANTVVHWEDLMRKYRTRDPSAAAEVSPAVVSAR
jgi:MFS superfamily sulfate permease-like transporter